MIAHAEQAYPNECCGLLLGQRSAAEKQVIEVHPVDNSWEPAIAEQLGGESHSPRDRYWIAPETLLAKMRYGRERQLEIIGVYHSHPDHPAAPSECDRQLAWATYSYLIFSVIAEEVAHYASWILDDHHQFQPEPITLEDPKIKN